VELLADHRCPFEQHALGGREPVESLGQGACRRPH
jgi:hypothetical protein